MSEITESSTNMPEQTGEVMAAESQDKLAAQLAAYKRCFSELQTELAEIEEKFGEDPEQEKEDPLKTLAGEVGGFKTELADLRKMLEELRSTSQSHTAPAPQQYAPQPQYYVQQQPMVTPTPLPYLQTPTFAPLMPSLPNFNR